MRRWVSAIAVIVLLAPAAALPQARSGKGGVYEQLNLFSEAFERIRQDAVEPAGDKKLVETAIAGMLAGLDPHAVYIPEAEYKAQQAPPPEQAGSIGLVLTIESGQLKVVSPRDGAPAAAAGVNPGDVIFMIDKEPTFDLSLHDVEQRLNGPPGSEVRLLVRRGTGAPTEIKIKRAEVNWPTVTSRLETGTIGYIRIAGFDAKTRTDLTAAIQDLRSKSNNKLIGFVLDLRNNPGGNFDAAVAAADALIDKGDIAVVKGRKPDDTRRIAATPGDIAKGLPIVTLVNSGTAREAELVAGALQDNKRSVLLGTKTFGESAIVSTIPLDGAGAIRLTTARFLTPSGRAIQGKGLEPDLVVAPVKIERLAGGERRREADLRGALKNTDPVPPTTPTAPGTKPPQTPSATTPAPAAAPASGPAEAAVATSQMGTAEDEQLIEAIDVLHGLAMVSARNTR
jgi:carboxyl-terminal processing protease